MDQARPRECPICGDDCVFHFHGCYPRRVYDALTGDPEVEILRYKSPSHGNATVSVLPEFLTPRKRYSLEAISLVFYLRFLFAWDVRRIHGSLLEASYSTMLEWFRHWGFNTVNLLQDGLPAIGMAVDSPGRPRHRLDFGAAAFLACVRHFNLSCDPGSFATASGDVPERVLHRGRSVLPRLQSALRESFPALWPFRESPARE